MHVRMFQLFGRLILLIPFLMLMVGGSPQSEYKEIADCSSENAYSSLDELIFVSTLDGRLTALNGLAGGILSWSIDTGPGPLLESSIHNLEMTNNGHWIRVIPSLSGGLYKFDGKTIETVPVTADYLLQSSSFLLRDGLVVSGGRESRTYGISLASGQVIYECSMKGCDNYTFNNMSDEIIIIRRHTQTVRAVDMRSGSERWNFSVGQHEVKLTYDPNCQKKKASKWLTDIQLKASLPDGIVCAVQKSTHNVIWKYKFSAPIVAVWSVEDGKMNPVDLFGAFESYAYNVKPSAPALYIGVHNKQMYVQESLPVEHSMPKQLLLKESRSTLSIPWKPVAVLNTAVASIQSVDGSNDVIYETNIPTTALSELHATEYFNDNGYYVFLNDNLDKNNLSQCNASIINITIKVNGDESLQINHLESEVTLTKIWTALQYWWKEIFVIVIGTVAINLVVLQRFIHQMKKNAKEDIKTDVVEDVISSSIKPSSEKLLNTMKESNGFEYTSRYLFDFEPIRCLGKGGFGVVFEAKNKIDECNYAIKRIALPNSQESRDRVMREVKALAKLDHQYIVRYFNAWVECPPPGWLEEHDLLYFARNDGDSAHDFTESPFSSRKIEVTHGETSRSTSNITHILKHFEAPSEMASDSQENGDSFIVFEYSQDENLPGSDVSHNSGMLQNVFTHESKQSISSCKEVLCETNFHSRNDCSEKCSSPGSKKNSRNILSPPTRMYLYIQMQLCLRESLQKWLCDNSRNRDRQKMLQMFEQIVQAVEYIHLEGLIHRDLKPSNIFFSMNGQIKVGDFGLVTPMLKNPPEGMFSETVSNKFSVKHTDQVGTQLYMSPEQMNGEPYDYKVDIYSLGLILFELLYPFSTQMERVNTLLNLRKNEFPENFVQQFKEEHNLLGLMLSHCPRKRPTTFGIRAQPPLSDYSNVNKEERPSSEWHFELPSRRRHSSKSSSLSSNCSFEGIEVPLIDT